MWIEIKCDKIEDYQADNVAPHTGMWIEIVSSALKSNPMLGCSPHGDVD